MKKLFILLLLFTMVMTHIPVLANDVEKEKMIVVFKEEIDEDLLSELDGDLVNMFTNLSAASVELPLSAIEELENHEEILSVEVDQPVSISAQTVDWGMEKIKAPLAWQSNFTGKGVKIAVLDTGIAVHEDLKVAGGVAITSYTNSFLDDNGHGTHVAGIIGAKDNQIGVVGVAPDAELYAVKVLDKSGVGYVSDIVAGIDWSISNKMDIINLSLGTANDSASLKQIVDKAYNNGILVVAAVGNNGTGSGNTVEFPARYHSAIAVSAIDSANKRGSFSATGPAVEVAAPGVNVFSTHLNNRYNRQNGTSMASAFVTGTLALLKESNPNLTNVQYRNKLQEMAVDLGPRGRDEHFGFGLVQVPFIAENESDEVEFSLKQGDRRPEVIQLKLDLERAGFAVSSNPTEYFGPITTEQVKQFQAAHGLQVTGVADSITLYKLKSVAEELEKAKPEAPSLTFKQGDYHDGIIQLKLDLEKAGFFVSTNPTNYYGPITTKKVKEFQLAYGLPADGIAGPRTLQKLNELINSSLKEGDRLPAVISLKMNLEKAGFQVSTNPNSYYGPITTRMVIEFQSHYGLPVNGIADPATIQRLNEVTTTSLKEGDRLPDVIQLKVDLERAGFRVSGNPTNYYGPNTAQKVKEFQSHIGLRATGVATPETRKRLIEAIRK
jgi:minor extracellular protease Epr